MKQNFILVSTGDPQGSTDLEERSQYLLGDLAEMMGEMRQKMFQTKKNVL